MMTVHARNAPQPDAGPRTGIKDYVRRVKIACDDLHDDPLNPAAWAALRMALRELLEPDITTTVAAPQQRQR